MGKEQQAEHTIQKDTVIIDMCDGTENETVVDTSTPRTTNQKTEVSKYEYSNDFAYFFLGLVCGLSVLFLAFLGMLFFKENTNKVWGRRKYYALGASFGTLIMTTVGVILFFSLRGS